MEVYPDVLFSLGLDDGSSWRQPGPASPNRSGCVANSSAGWSKTPIQTRSRTPTGGTTHDRDGAGVVSEAVFDRLSVRGATVHVTKHELTLQDAGRWVVVTRSGGVFGFVPN